VAGSIFYWTILRAILYREESLSPKTPESWDFPRRVLPTASVVPDVSDIPHLKVNYASPKSDSKAPLLIP
jgi:hypothetical protein